ncbi:predicted protein [Coccidioides posadasii str. Silveira]|uniref:Predicted protein n=1 Tax=Coccidioides posadasii (strain RMSCC 757 / Silveira) TaxID=443226 RepID=E9CR01_COCPS|nr:predicted protein [Coccidioides posadasii str. Silveira]
MDTITQLSMDVIPRLDTLQRDTRKASGVFREKIGPRMPNPRLKAHWPSNRWGFDEQHDGCNQAEALAVFCLLGMSLEAVDGDVGAAGWDVVARRQSPLRARRAGSDWAPTAIQSQRAAGVGGQNAVLGAVEA